MVVTLYEATHSYFFPLVFVSALKIYHTMSTPSKASIYPHLSIVIMFDRRFYKFLCMFQCGMLLSPRDPGQQNPTHNKNNSYVVKKWNCLTVQIETDVYEVAFWAVKNVVSN